MGPPCYENRGFRGVLSRGQPEKPEIRWIARRPGTRPVSPSHDRDRNRGLERPVGGHRRWAGRAFCGRDREDQFGRRPRHRHWHGQERARRAQIRRDARLDGNACLFRPPRRSEPWRPRGHLPRRRDRRVVLVRRDGRAQGPHRLREALQRCFDRDYRATRLHARPRRGRGAGSSSGTRGMLARPRADHIDADAARTRRRGRRGTVREPRLYRAPVQGPASRRTPRCEPHLRSRRDAHRDQHSASCCRELL